MSSETRSDAARAAGSILLAAPIAAAGPLDLRFLP